jgi:hypothetical protein
VIDVPNTYATELSLARRTVILKMRGQVDPSDDSTRDSFVVTEDDYIDYLGRADVSAGVPVGLRDSQVRLHGLRRAHGADRTGAPPRRGGSPDERRVG